MKEQDLVVLLKDFCVKLFNSKRDYNKIVKFERTKEGVLLIDEEPTLYSKLKNNG